VRKEYNFGCNTAETTRCFHIFIFLLEREVIDMTDAIQHRDNAVKAPEHHNPLVDLATEGRKLFDDFANNVAKRTHTNAAHEVNNAADDKNRRALDQADRFLPQMAIPGDDRQLADNSLKAYEQHNPIEDAARGARKAVDDFVKKHHLDLAHEVNNAADDKNNSKNYAVMICIIFGKA
jgi:hypothetical protein